MNTAKRELLQKAGFRLGSVQDFLGLSDLENRIVELKYGVSKAVKQRRVTLGLTQQDVARRIRSSQSRVAKIEAGSADVSLDLLVRCLFAVGGELEVEKAAAVGEIQRASRTSAAKAKKKKEEPIS